MKKPILFHLQRHADISGVSGTGRVADGVIWSDGTVAIRWLGDRPSTVVWDHIGHAKAVHGHGGSTEIVLADDPAARLARIAEAHQQETGPGGLTSGRCNECGEPSPCPTYTWATTNRDPLATWDPADDDTEETDQ